MATTLRGDDNFDTASPIPAGEFTAKAWVNFNGTGTVAIRDSGNVSSLVDRGTGRYDFNLTNAVSSTNLAVSGAMQGTPNTNYGWLLTYPDNTDFSTSHFPIRCNYAGLTGGVDATYAMVTVTL